MIRLTRLNQNELVINAEMIEFVEAIPDTIVERIVEYKRTCNQVLVSG